MERHFRNNCSDQSPVADKRLRFILKLPTDRHLWPISRLQILPLTSLLVFIQIISMKDDTFYTELKNLHRSCGSNFPSLVEHQKKLQSRMDELNGALRFFPCYQCVREGKGLSKGCGHANGKANEESPSKRRNLN